MDKNKVLIDLSFGAADMGHSGIPQDSRFLFAGLTGLESIDMTGFVWSYKKVWSGGRLDRLLNQSVYLGPYFSGDHFENGVIEKALAIISSRLSALYRGLMHEFKTNYKIYDLPPKIFNEILWRNIFSVSIDPKHMENVLSKNFAITPLGLPRVIHSTIGLAGLPVKLNTSNYDWVVFQDSRKISVSSNTRKVIRYHDAIPLFASDTMDSDSPTKFHVHSLKASAKDSFFVCNSPSSLQELITIAPAAAKNARVIPYFVPEMEPLIPTGERLKEVTETRFSTATISSNRYSEIERFKRNAINKWFEDSDDIPQYLMTLSTIEPRKNITGLISAWQRLKEKNPSLKLLIVGKPGWKYAKTLEAMKPFVRKGQIMHLESVPQRELRYLYSAAACFVFPSFAEGFGLPPVEAMQCHCPVVVSDLPAHRYMAGDAALFCNPYDRKNIADQIEEALHPDNSSRLIELGIENAGRFTVDKVLPLWDELFNSDIKFSK